MIEFHSQVWVTSVLCNEDVAKALLLVSSLRRVFTTRKIAVIASPKVSPELRQALNHGIDLVFYLEEDQNTVDLKMEDFAKVYSLLALRTFKQCAYVSPTMMALKNCDDIFETPTNTFTFLDDIKNTSVFLFKPSLDLYEALMTWLEKSQPNGTSIGVHLRKWKENQAKTDDTISGKFCKVLSPRKPLIGHEDELAMVNLVECPNELKISELGKTGTLGKLVAFYWSKIQMEDVLPLINYFSVSRKTLIKTEVTPKYRISGSGREPIAIVGMSCRYPGSNNLEEFWNLLFEGEDATCNPPPFRWLKEQCSFHRADARQTNAGFLKVPVDEFDAKFFGISPKEVESLDPQHRLLHELVWEGLEDACVNPHTLRGTSGSVFVGSWLNDYRDILGNTATPEFFRSYMGTSIGAAAARISFLLGMTGPSLATESGCSSAIVAVHLACQALQLGRTNLALACGVNLLLHQFDKDEMPMVISPDGHCKTFSEDADGFARAEGGGVLVLKRLSDAINDGDHIWGLLKGSSMSQEGVSKSMGTPTVHCESLAMKEALEDANVSPHQVSYVEAHGTGTVVGDPMEVAAIAKAYNSPQRKEPLIIGSVKTNVGHTESCSGITGIMKVILAMKHEIIPKHRNFTKLNPSIDLNAVPAVIPLEPMDWKKVDGKPRFAGVSSFGITGTDAHVIIEEPPQTQEIKPLSMNSMVERPKHILKLSAKSEEAMALLLEKYKEAFQTCNHSIADIAFSANTGRANFHIRATVVGNTTDDICKAIEQQKYLRGEVNSENLGKVCFLFTGQGSQYPGMAKTLYETSPVFQMHFDHCTKILSESYGVNILDVLWSSKLDSSDEISRTIYSQTSIFCVEYALLKLWESWGVKPDFVLGHSLGEFCAAVCAGILTVEDAIKLVAVRSQLIDELPRGKMLVIRADQQQVEKAMKEFAGANEDKLLDYAAINSSQQTVVAGDSDVILEFSKYCERINLKSIVLGSTHAFHSKHMDAMLENYRTSAKTINILSNYKCEYISGMRGDLISGSSVDANYWVQHTRDKVNFMSASKKAVELGCNIFIEIGPQPVLSALTMMNNDANLTCLPSLKKKEDEWSTLLTTLGKLYVQGVDIDWAGFEQFRNRNKVRLPHYPFIGKKFWPDLVQKTGKVIHPLVGSVIPNASSIKLFQSGINLNTHEWVKDHAIGQTAVFPGAGYLEMCLAAGLAAVEGSVGSLSRATRPMKVENLKIKAPLAIQDSKTVQVQTSVELNTLKDNENDWNDMSVKIFHRVESDLENKWLPHATATFSPLPTAEELFIPFNKEHFLNSLELPSKMDEISEIYEKLASVGLHFGPIFRSLEKFWKSDDGTLLFKVKVPTSDANSESTPFILHPAVMDAMIQATMMPKLTSESKKRLYVPIEIGKFLWLSHGSDESTDRFIYVNGNAQPTALLLDSIGTVLAVMSDVQLIDTSVKTVESVLEQQSSKLPQMWEETWRPQLGPLEHAHDAALWTKEKFYTDEYFNQIIEKYDKMTPELEDIVGKLRKLSYYCMLRSMYQCGFQPVFNTVYDQDELLRDLKVESQYAKMFGYFLRVLSKEGILEREGPELWKLVSLPPSLEELEKLLASPIFAVDLVNAFKPTLLMLKIGENLSEILQGRQSALNILFPDEDTKSGSSSAAEFYTVYGHLSLSTSMATDVGTLSILSLQSQMSPGNRYVMRICEIGAGTGAFTEGLIKTLVENDMEFEFTYTDISAAFFPAAEKRFEKHLSRMKFKKLNIEEDPISQGFVPAYYDYIVASDVIHATKNLKETVNNVRLLLKPGGRFDMLEMTKVNRIITYIFGFLDGFWRFEDFHLRPDHCTPSTQGWIKALESGGLEVIEAFPCSNQHHSLICSKRRVDDAHLNEPGKKAKAWVVFHEEGNVTSDYILKTIPSLTNRMVVVVQRGKLFEKVEHGSFVEFRVRQSSEEDFVEVINYVENCDGVTLEGVLYCWGLAKESKRQEDILRPFFHLSKAILRLKHGAGLKLVALTKGVMPLEGSDVSQFQQSTIPGFMKAFKNERFEINSRCIEIGDNESEERLQQIFYELWIEGKDALVAYQGTTRYTPKVTSLKPALSDLKPPPGSGRFQLILPETKSIGDLQFGPLEPLVLDKSEVEIQVKSSALNFKDVLNILKPSEEFKDSNAVGFDFAGVVRRVHPQVTKWRVGDEVFGININGAALPSHIKLHEDAVLPIPKEMTFNEACTLPAVVATSYHCLIDVAKIKPGDTVLIHTASGGVGLSAIEICKHVGATIISTAGSKRKQKYLKSLGIQHIFHSRNTNYGDQILEVTNGRGVDVVLNSLTSEGFKEATLKACARGARFVEMSKLSVWTPEEVQRMRPDVQYTIVDLTALNEMEWTRLLTKLKELISQDVVKPIPYVRFDAVHIREALQFLQKAKHIGKVVVTLPEVKNVNGVMETYTPMFSSKGTYLITGGLGGIGLEVCKWMVKSGAKYVILAGRNPPTSSTASLITALNAEHSTKIQAVQLDVSSYDQCKDLIEKKMLEMGYPVLRGVMHAAGTLHDALVENQNWENLSSTFGTKVEGTFNLHELTKNNPRLEHFVLFSSVAALFGSPGQSNHSAGNQFEDAIAHYRHSIGLPATSVNWGQWGEVGVAKEVDLPGIKPFSTLHGINGLEYAMKSQRVQTAVLNMDSFLLLSKLIPHLLTHLDERVWKSSGASSTSVHLKSDEFWQEYDSIESLEGKHEFAKEKLRTLLRNILKLDESDTFEDNADLQDLGVDSLMFVEIKNAIQSLLGDRVTIQPSLLRDCNTVKLLSETLVRIIEATDLEESVPTAVEVNKLIKEDIQLPEHIAAKPEQQKLAVEEISSVLLTGVTGTLGPYILKELCKLPQIRKITCLIRPKRNLSGEERLRNLLKDRNLLADIDMTKISCLNGNVALSQLGVADPKIWKHLCDEVDGVFHCAALVQHMEYYRKEDGENNMRQVNIGGLKNVLEFCCTGGKLKHIWNASTLLALATLNEDGNLSESWPESGDFDDVTYFAYPITKFVGDVIMREALTKRGIPGKVFRLPFISGDSKTGRFVLDQNHFMLRYIFTLKTGTMSSNPFPLLILPVDICAKLSIEIFFNKNASDGIYNIVNAKPDTDQEFVSVAKRLGYEVGIVDFLEFAKKVREGVTAESPMAIFKDFYTNEEDIMALYGSAPALKQWLLEGAGKENFFMSKKVATLIPGFYDEGKEGQIPSMEYVYRDLLFAKEQGWLKKFGL